MDFEVDQMVFEILKDGTIKTTTDQVSPANHDSAEEFLNKVQELAGGQVTITEREGAAHHHHHTHTDHQHLKN